MQKFDPTEIVAATQAWLEKIVIGLNLCPFAKAVYVKKQIRYVVSDAETADELHAALLAELKNLVAADPVEMDTSLLIHPYVLMDFMDYNDFLDVADEALHEAKVAEDIQIASFHPHYQFAETEPDGMENYTNRSPFPMLHLLRESSVARAVAAFPDAANIFENNIQTMRRLGYSEWVELIKYEK
jgi:uncharacterized protein